MTFIAQQALRDAIYVREKLAEHPQDTEWRVLWTAGVSLLRTVGFALKNRDVPEENEAERLAYRESWDQWKAKSEENNIWHNFIDYERNRLLKEYRSDVAEQQATFMAPGMNIVISNDPRTGMVEIDEGEPIKGIEVRHIMVAGPFEGRNALDLFDEALEWLRREIGKIEARIKEIQKE